MTKKERPYDEQMKLLDDPEFFNKLKKKGKYGLARIGLIALIDEATGYQEVRPGDELNKMLEEEK